MYDKCTAILCAVSPESVPFMADEAVLSVPGLGKMTYNLKHYMAYANKVLEKVKLLNRAGRAKGRGEGGGGRG